ncbi:hypothetical protein CBM2592_B120033 [Cupriavidus taiwanensis]|nr:hypothetical protein CBM2588_B150032 [Cupriavidus taiwanensis]SOY64965.1 hypothetical protein CBM2592_B120033 [Cupriavidus taiwanensis]SOY94105.1 hypothetical protein CBM2591_B110031 [Cupriavidus taiwanensis]SOZ69331.1 hypothetical protein CBM2617_B150032 [Cupriavidus taiwanensis]SOZ85746.1 hypothetical protein CBM2618_B150032 [Cupriavidus taiwanensis]
MCGQGLWWRDVRKTPPTRCGGVGHGMCLAFPSGFDVGNQTAEPGAGVWNAQVIPELGASRTPRHLPEISHGQ